MHVTSQPVADSDRWAYPRAHRGSARRLRDWRPPAPRYTTGVLAKYIKLVQPAATGAVTG